MHKSLRKKLFLGVLVSIGCVLFLIGIFFIGRKQIMYTDTFFVYTSFSDINGLREGDFVRYSGNKVGVVEKIKFVTDSTILVQMKLEKTSQPFLKKDIIAYIGSDGLVGYKLINLRSKHQSRDMIQENDTLESINPFNMDEIINKLASTNDNVETITSNLARISKKLNDKKGLLDMLISDTVSSNSLKETFSYLNVTGKQMMNLSRDFERTVDKINISGGLVGTLLNDTTLTQELKQTLVNLKLSSDYSTTITNQINKSLQNGDQNALGMLMKDSAFAQGIRQSVINLQLGTEKLDKDMEALQHSFLLKGYFKRKNKANNK